MGWSVRGVGMLSQSVGAVQTPDSVHLDLAVCCHAGACYLACGAPHWFKNLEGGQQ